MVDKYAPPFGTYTSVQVASANAQLEILADLRSFALLFGIVLVSSTSVSYNGVASVPDFNKLSDGMRHKIGDEILAMAAAIDAMPTA